MSITGQVDYYAIIMPKKKVFYHILDLGFESVRIPVRIKFEFEVKAGVFVPESLSIESLYNQQAVAGRYPHLKKDALEKEIQKTIRREICNYLQNCGYLSEEAIKEFTKSGF